MSDEGFYDKEYPTDVELMAIANWPSDDPKGLIDYVMDLWHWSDLAIYNGDGALTLHTGGWSGNESIIQAMEPTIFWLMYWYSTTSGGHYVFKLRS